MKHSRLALVMMFGACGGGDGTVVDAPADAIAADGTPTDGTMVDAPSDGLLADAPNDAGANSYVGWIAVNEVAYLNPGTSGTFHGQGIEASIAFTDSAALPGPVQDQQPGTIFGCKAWSYSAADATAAWLGTDEGSVELTFAGTTAPTLPACAYAAGPGYACADSATENTGGAIAPGPSGGTATLTDSDNTFSAANSLGRYVRLAGASNAANNGTFPILAVASATSIVYANPAMVSETLPSNALHVNVAGAGPIPTVADPGFLGDDSSATATLIAGGGGNVAAFAATISTSIGDDFRLGLAELNTLNAIPFDGTQFSVTCTSADCPAGSAIGSMLDIVTTDSPTAGLSPFAMPPPVNTSVHVRCFEPGVTAVTVPASLSAHLQNSGATRIRAAFIRPNVYSGTTAGVTAVAGHAIVGFTSR
jgi:hypothetical protein